MRIIDGYTIGQEIARGAQAIIYQGTTPQGYPCAFKEYSRGEADHEYAALQRIASVNPNLTHVVRTFGLLNDGNVSLIAEELLGPSLQDILSQHDITPYSFVHIASDTAQAILEVSRATMSHCDIKPDNFMVTKSHRRTVLADCGLAVTIGSPKRGDTELIAAPELARGSPSATSDCYSWAKMLELLLVSRTDVGPRYSLTDIPGLEWVGEPFAELLRSCTHDNPQARPRPDRLAHVVKQALSGLLKSQLV
jgi:serine/threonine protein kinase